MSDLVPQVGDACMADPEVEGEFLYGHITRIDSNGMAYTDIEISTPDGLFVGDVPTFKQDGVWVFDSF